jgi:hypothetical protein
MAILCWAAKNSLRGTSSPFSLLYVLRIGALVKRFPLKVPKREIFDLSDFPNFYTIKSLPVGDFGVKIKIFVKNISGVI